MTARRVNERRRTVYRMTDAYPETRSPGKCRPVRLCQPGTRVFRGRRPAVDEGDLAEPHAPLAIDDHTFPEDAGLGRHPAAVRERERVRMVWDPGASGRMH
jgi:hypothetical protein